MGALLKFTRTSERNYSRDLGGRVVVRVQGGAGAAIQHPYGSARISITARHPRSIVVRGQNDNRIPSPLDMVSRTGDLAGETGANSCASLTGLFISQGALADVKFVRALKASRSLLLCALQAGKQTARCFTNVLKSFLRGAVAHDEQYASKEFHDDGKIRARPRNLTARDGNYAC